MIRQWAHFNVISLNNTEADQRSSVLKLSHFKYSIPSYGRRPAFDFTPKYELKTSTPHIENWVWFSF